MSEKLTALSWSGRWLTHTVPHCSNDGSHSVSESHFDETRRDAMVAWHRIVMLSSVGVEMGLAGLFLWLSACIASRVYFSVYLPLCRSLCLAVSVCVLERAAEVDCVQSRWTKSVTWRFVVTCQSNKLHGFSVSRCRRRHLMAVTRPSRTMPRTTNS